jgi:alanyl aminopeptidase
LYLVGIILFWTSLLAQSDDPHRLGHKVEPVYQFIQLNLDPDEDVYTGSTSLELEIKEDVNHFRLHGKEFEIINAELEQEEIAYPINTEFQKYGFLKVIPEKTLSAGKYILNIHFGGFYDTKGQGICG